MRPQVAVITLALSALLQTPFLAAPVHAVPCPATITVATASDLANVENCLSSSFIQTADIVLTGTWTPIGTSGSEFTGTYDGDGFRISGLLTTDHDASYVGLFGSVNTGAVIRDTHVSGTIIGARYVGGLIGNARGATVLDSTAAVTVSEITPRYEREYIGGLIGSARDSTIARSHASGSISLPSVDYLYVGGLIGRAEDCDISASSASGDVDGGNDVGGLAGFIGGGSLSTSFATGAVSARGIAGGLAGRVSSAGAAPNAVNDVYARGSVTSSGNNVGALIGRFDSFGGTRGRGYATGLTTGADPTGGFLGAVLFSLSDANWTSGYWDIQATGQAAASGSGIPTGLTGQTTTAMKSIDTYIADGWSIGGWAASGTTWGICAGVNDGYPYLQAFYASNPCDDGPTPPPWPQAYARASGDTCLPGWNPSWAQWPNGNTGGFVCQRTLVYNRSTGQWDARRLMHASFIAL